MEECGPSPSLRIVPWHLPYNWGKSTETPQSGSENLSEGTEYILPKSQGTVYINEIAVNQDYDSQTKKPRNETTSHHTPCTEVEGAVLTSRAEQYLTPSWRCWDTPTAAHPQISHTSSVSTALLNHKPHTVNMRRHNNCEIWSSHSDVAEDTRLLGCYTDLLRKYPSFRSIVALESSGSRNQDVCVIVKMTALRSFKLFTGGHCVTKHPTRLGLSY